MMTFWLCLSMLLADVPTRPSACEADDDCVITAQAACCSCCPGVPRSVSRQELAEQDCSAKNCGVVPCKGTACQPVQDLNTLQAVCRAGTCRAEPAKVKKNPSLCIRDSDCVAASFSCCETCCPPPTIAATQAELDLKRGECPAKRCSMIRCAVENCPAQAPPGVAVCRSNRCELAPAR